MTTQTQLILKELKANRTVSNLTATHMNIGNIKDVILKLRRAGHPIVTRSHTDPLGNNYTRWELA